MKKLNQKAALTFNAMIEQMNGEQHLKIDNTGGVFMPVIIEKIGENIDLAGRPVDIYSLSHYYEQNGDLVPDPDMTFAVHQHDNMYIYAMTIQNFFGYKEAIFVKNGTWRINKAEQADQAYFANQWLENIKYQQGIKARTKQTC